MLAPHHTTNRHSLRQVYNPDSLPIVTLATALLIVLAVGLHFRSPVTPVVNLLTVGIAFVVASYVLDWLGQTFGLAVPREVEPVVVLLFGVVTDDSIFFLSRFCYRLREGCSERDAAERRSADVLGIVLVAGLIVALVPLTTFRAVALTMGLGLLLDAFLVRQLLVPALVVLVGRLSGWPGRLLGREPKEHEGSHQADASHG